MNPAVSFAKYARPQICMPSVQTLFSFINIKPDLLGHLFCENSTTTFIFESSF